MSKARITTALLVAGIDAMPGRSKCTLAQYIELEKSTLAGRLTLQMEAGDG